ncbi:hypothetical protein BpHYR1_045248 [Brachionus plicatilis]|uniref:Uncharacterized protein n=1 Tax=Brachionus plicatilis TaxID=10195 RepID=A0A3M7SG40_BRAPC|nr:hypothetical protein BpHYR1_045248 [Brachionus plicatilis]
MNGDKKLDVLPLPFANGNFFFNLSKNAIFNQKPFCSPETGHRRINRIFLYLGVHRRPRQLGYEFDLKSSRISSNSLLKLFFSQQNFNKPTQKSFSEITLQS